MSALNYTSRTLACLCFPTWVQELQEGTTPQDCLAFAATLHIACCAEFCKTLQCCPAGADVPPRLPKEM